MKEPITLREASPTDLPFLVLLRKLTVMGHLGLTDQPSDETAYFRSAWFSIEGVDIICFESDSIGILKTIRSNCEWFIEQIQILPSHQGRGIGREVMSSLLTEAKQMGLPVSLNVLRDNPARRLYERLGFRISSKTEFELRMAWFP